jgi:hypothetical protein
MKDVFGRKISFAMTEVVGQYPVECARILHLIFGEDISHVFVSDESTMGDFPLDEDGVADMSLELGVPVGLSDLFIDVCKRLHEATAN